MENALELEENGKTVSTSTPIFASKPASSKVSDEPPSDDDEVRKRFATDPDEFVCAITYNIMEDPVLAADGKSYERVKITEWLEKSNTSPIMGLEIERTVTPNHALKKEIESWKVTKEAQKVTKERWKVTNAAEAAARELVAIKAQVQKERREKAEIQAQLEVERAAREGIETYFDSADDLQEQLEIKAAANQTLLRLGLEKTENTAAFLTEEKFKSLPKDVRLTVISDTEKVENIVIELLANAKKWQG
ncbi:hypothetical protein TL16_g09007 [Triparma laevis f. inornata]|uniref:U-box domain-containing protein n=1 Tax=Triparma laevis f. inornata TaxID=1714386 RepID=A0A9W7EKZ5_9STRA|nr:hypothetical protein TL16_g09007 [Triparma laevis f. inornata]